MHLPIRQWPDAVNGGAGLKPAEPILRGVLSAQSYKPGLWTRRDTPFVLDLQARADEAAHHWFNTLQKSPAPV